MKKITIIINGKGGAGKDTMCEMAAKHFRTMNVSSIDPIKKIASQNGWNGEKDDKSRKFLADLKKIFTDYNDLPTEYFSINSEATLTEFLNSGEDTYGVLTQDIIISSKPSTRRVLAAGKTLNGNGHTITAKHQSNGYSGNNERGVGNRGYYVENFGFDGSSSDRTSTTDQVNIGVGGNFFGASDIVSVNYGAIKNLNFISNASQRVYISPRDGNVAMGGIAGINFGNIENCTVQVSNGEFGIVGSQWAYSGTTYNLVPAYYWYNGEDVSTQNVIAFGGVAGVNKGNIVSVSVRQNKDMGIFFSDYNGRNGHPCINNAIQSGIAGGVVGLNDEGVINGVDFYGGECWLYNSNWHNSTSYIGGIVGLANLQADGAEFIVNGVKWSIGKGSVQNITMSVHTNYAFYGTRYGGQVEKRATDVNGYRASTSDTLTYSGVIGGMLTTNEQLAENIVISGGNISTLFTNDSKNTFRKWAATEYGAAEAKEMDKDADDTGTPIFGYGDTSTSGRYYAVLDINTKAVGKLKNKTRSTNFVFFSIPREFLALSNILCPISCKKN